MPSTDYLSKLAAHNQLHGITATFSEMKKTARRMQKLNEETGMHVEVEAFFLLHSDPTGEDATANVMAERAAANAANAARRLAA
jgi:ABC-type Zn uptake system ZnuABC Zn-binding protein ZnuA